MESFRKLGIIEPILKVIQEEGFTEPTEIQEKSIPLVVAGKDIIAGAATGSGKTLAFASGIIKDCERGKNVQALVLTPTRELAEQEMQAFIKFSKYKPLEVTSVYGGVSINPQIYALETADVVIGTPGRILDHLHRGTLNLKHVKILVLDEADRMLDMGFIDDVETIISQCPKNRQTLLFSATISSDIMHIAKKHMKYPVEVSAESHVDPKKLKQIFYDVPDNMKFSLLVHLLKNEKTGMAMVFCNTQRNTDFVTKHLKKNGIEALAIHGGFSQAKRSYALESFHCQRVCILVCTDVAARGLDIKGVTHIYNYDTPQTSKEYIHRIGRTARAGKEGKAISIIASRDYENFSRVLGDRELKIENELMPVVEKIELNLEHDREGGRRHAGYFGRGFRGRREGGHGGGYRREGPREHSEHRGPREGAYGEKKEFRGERKFGDREHTGFSGERRFSRPPRRDSRSRNFSRFRRY
jgi:ATP-dependent RNA helicase DeaD